MYNEEAWNIVYKNLMKTRDHIEGLQGKDVGLSVGYIEYLLRRYTNGERTVELWKFMEKAISEYDVEPKRGGLVT